MVESWEEMEARHAKERRAKLDKVANLSYRQGADRAPLTIHGKAGVAGINAMVAAKYGLKPHEMKTRRRSNTYTHPRYEVMYLAKEEGHSLSQIGRFYGFDHTTVMNGIRRHKVLQGT